MAHKYFDRVCELTAVTGTGTLTLLGAKPGGYQAFGDVLSDGDEITICITDYTDFEVVKGVYGSSGDTITRATVQSSSNSNSNVDWGSGNKDVFLVRSAIEAINIYGTSTFIADQSMGTNKLTNLSDGTALTDAMNLGQLYKTFARKFVDYYCDSNVTIASTNAGATFDGATSASGESVILGGQTDPVENGVYDINPSGGLTRRSDFSGTIDPRGIMFYVTRGSTYNDTLWGVTSNGSVIDTNNITFNLLSFSNPIAGNGLVRSGNALNVVGTSGTITVSSDAITIASTYVGQTSITTLGTIATGVWNATTIAVGKGGTGTTDGSITGTGSLTFTSTGSSSTITLVPGASTGYVSINGSLKVKKVYTDWVSATDGATVTFDCSLGNKHKVILDGNRTLAVSNIEPGQTIWIQLIQDGTTGNRTVTWFSTITWVDGSAPTLATAINKRDDIIIECTGSGTYIGYPITPSGGY